MLSILKPLARPCPAWLKTLDPARIPEGPGPWMKHILQDALVYPGSGLDGSPVRQCLGVVHSFIFLDYGTSVQEVMAELTKKRKTGTGFAHHRLLGMAVFNPTSFIANAPEAFTHPGTSVHDSGVRTGVWAIFEGEGPCEGERFSFLFMGVEAVQALAALFPLQAPKALVLQEHGFGGNCWPSFREPIVRLSEEWKTLPQLLIVQAAEDREDQLAQLLNRPWLHTPFRSLGTDKATESMHGTLREFLQAATHKSRAICVPR